MRRLLLAAALGIPGATAWFAALGALAPALATRMFLFPGEALMRLAEPATPRWITGLIIGGEGGPRAAIARGFPRPQQFLDDRCRSAGRFHHPAMRAMNAAPM